MILTVVSKEYETWSLTSVHSLRVCENRLLRAMFALTVDKVRRWRRRVHSEELHNPYVSLNIIKGINKGG
jgi:hypothetical protein